MSYVIHVWESPLPVTFADATTTVFERGADKVGQNPSFLVLAGRLKARYPCLTIDDNAVWSDGPLDGVTEERVLVLGITRHHVEVASFVRSTAAALKLCVYNMQAGQVYLPDGGVLGPQPQAAPAPLQFDEPELELDEVRDTLYDGLMTILRPCGFKRRYGGSPHLYLQFPGGRFRVVLAITDHAPLFNVGLFAAIRLDQLVEMIHCLDRLPAGQPDEADCGILRYSDFAPERTEILIRHRHDLCAAAAEICHMMSTQMLPAMEQCMQVDGFDRLVNDPASNDRFLGSEYDVATRVLLAGLAGNPTYEDIAARGIARLRALGHVHTHRLTTQTEALLNYLRKYDPANPPALPANPFDDIAGFIARYDQSQADHIRCQPSAPGAKYFEDANDSFRSDLKIKSGVPVEEFPLALVRDLFIAEAQMLALNPRQGTLSHIYARQLALRCDEEALDLFIRHIPQELWERGLGSFPAEPAARMTMTCRDRALDPAYAGQAAAYAALGDYLGKMVAPGR